MMKTFLLSLTLITNIFINSFEAQASGVNEATALLSAAQKLKAMNVCKLGAVDVNTILEDMESLDKEGFDGLKELAQELNHKGLKKHLDKYTFEKNYYISYETDECDWENLIIQVNRDQGQAKGLILLGEDLKTRDL